MQDETPEWAWLGLVLMVDVAHVWGTGLRVYIDGQEIWRRPWLYLGVPLACLALSNALYSLGPLYFWRGIAYAAVWHFVRQQVGWVRLYHRRNPGDSGVDRALDEAAIYAATLYPLLWWHTHLPRHFAWMMQGDFVPMPASVILVAGAAVSCVATLYIWRFFERLLRGVPQWGKDAVVASTAVCWGLGIVVCNSDYAFTVTNIPIHGVPYVMLVFFYGQKRGAASGYRGVWRLFAGGMGPLWGLLWSLAFAEEFFWDHAGWQERPWLFGTGYDLTWWKNDIVPILAVPQLTHYVFDGFVWKRSGNPHWLPTGQRRT